ncbi:MAG TPA: hypothetical protein VGO48_03505 [Conexibacter sp.]|jgi:hypothetical protein|nr:hypothetical protein [Conexibacter sp.]
MKHSTKALVMTTMVAALAATAPVAHAVSPVVTLRGSAWLSKVQGSSVTPAVFHVDTAFSTDTPGAPLFTIQQAVIFFPDHAGTNGRLFPSCSAQQIERFRGNVKRCPRGSKIGSGTVTAQALQLGITARGQVAMFNGPGGRSITLNIRTLLPAYINESIDAPLTQLHGRYGEKLTLVVPHSLQEILSGVFVGVKDFDVSLTGVTRRNGVEYSFLRARRCPKTALHGVFDFKDWPSGQTASTTIDTKVRCRAS